MDMIKNKIVRSFVKRYRKMTDYQEDVFKRNWQVYGIEINADHLINTDDCFRNNNRLVLDIGFGCGDSLISQAIENSNINFIGVEVYQPGIRKLFHQLALHNINNVKVIYGDVTEIISSLPDECISKVQIYFPDPWPKRRHLNRRLINERFIEKLTRLVKKCGILHIKTDIDSYANHITHMFNKNIFYRQVDEHIYDVKESLTKYEAKGLSFNRNIWSFKYEKI
jgi:tRNA (guanine-N7-)-methyltransferase